MTTTEHTITGPERVDDGTSASVVITVNRGGSVTVSPGGAVASFGSPVTVTPNGTPVVLTPTSLSWVTVASTAGTPAQSGASVPVVGSYGLDPQGRVITDLDGTTYTYDDANGGRVATIAKSGTTRTAQYDGSGNLTGWI